MNNNVNDTTALAGDITQRLRAGAAHHVCDGFTSGWEVVMREAADEIDRLRANRAAPTTDTTTDLIERLRQCALDPGCASYEAANTSLFDDLADMLENGAVIRAAAQPPDFTPSPDDPDWSDNAATVLARLGRAATIPLSEMVRVMCPRTDRECECAVKGRYQDFDSCRLVYRHANALQDHMRKSPVSDGPTSGQGEQ